MPLASVFKHGAKLCSAKSKRTGLPCNNPAAHGCKTCRMHGAHKSRNVANGAKSGKYKNGHFTKEAKKKSSENLVRLRYLEDIGQQGGFMTGAKTRGPKPTGYVKLDMKNKEELVIALKVIEDQK
jgi:ribosomal protein L32E